MTFWALSLELHVPLSTPTPSLHERTWRSPICCRCREGGKFKALLSCKGVIAKLFLSTWQKNWNIQENTAPHWLLKSCKSISTNSLCLQWGEASRNAKNLNCRILNWLTIVFTTGEDVESPKSVYGRRKYFQKVDFEHKEERRIKFD